MLALLAPLVTGTGCYYGHLAGGQARVLWARRSVEDVLADPATSGALRDKLRLVERARAWARGLGLEVDGQYTSYVPWPGDRIVTSLIVTEPGSTEARPFTFPILGAVPYKGFFDVERARAEADRFAERGMDTCLVAVPAYSTLGFFDDPLTDPMLRGDDGRVVETVLHELVHATVFIESEPALNEGAAQFVGEEASVRFFAERDPQRAARRRTEVLDERRIADTLMALRARIADLYAESPTPEERTARRAALERHAREALAALPLSTREAADVAERVRLGDACLALRGAYAGDLARHQAVLDALDGDLTAFVARLVAAADADDPRAAFFAIAGDTDDGATIDGAERPPTPTL